MHSMLIPAIMALVLGSVPTAEHQDDAWVEEPDHDYEKEEAARVASVRATMTAAEEKRQRRRARNLKTGGKKCVPKIN